MSSIFPCESNSSLAPQEDPLIFSIPRNALFRATVTTVPPHHGMVVETCLQRASAVSIGDNTYVLKSFYGINIQQYIHIYRINKTNIWYGMYPIVDPNISKVTQGLRVECSVGLAWWTWDVKVWNWEINRDSINGDLMLILGYVMGYNQH